MRPDFKCKSRLPRQGKRLNSRLQQQSATGQAAPSDRRDIEMTTTELSTAPTPDKVSELVAAIEKAVA